MVKINPKSFPRGFFLIGIFILYFPKTTSKPSDLTSDLHNSSLGLSFISLNFSFYVYHSVILIYLLTSSILIRTHVMYE